MAPLLALLAVVILLGTDPGWAWSEPGSSRGIGGDIACCTWALHLGPGNVFDTITDGSARTGNNMGDCDTGVGAGALFVSPGARRDFDDFVGRVGLRSGSMVSERGKKVAIVHPITMEVLGEYDEPGECCARAILRP